MRSKEKPFWEEDKMDSELVNAIKKNTEVLFTNANIMLQTCNPEYVLCGMPVWKHAYHMLHSCDQWFINPTEYSEPDFHVPNLNSLDISCEKSLSREELLQYAHLGNINTTTIMETNQWPRVVGLTGKSGKSTEGLFE